MSTTLSTVPERDLRDAGVESPTPAQLDDFGRRWIAAAERIGRRYGVEVEAYADGRPWTHTVDDDEWERDQAIWQQAHDETPARRPGRPPVGAQINVSFPADVLARVDAAAERGGVSRSEWIRRACLAAL